MCGSHLGRHIGNTAKPHFIKSTWRLCNLTISEQRLPGIQSILMYRCGSIEVKELSTCVTQIGFHSTLCDFHHQFKGGYPKTVGMFPLVRITERSRAHESTINVYWTTTHTGCNTRAFKVVAQPFHPYNMPSWDKVVFNTDNFTFKFLHRCSEKYSITFPFHALFHFGQRHKFFSIPRNLRITLICSQAAYHKRAKQTLFHDIYSSLNR